MITILLWIYGISLLINEYDSMNRKGKEYYWGMITRYSIPSDTIIQKIFGSTRILVKGTLLLPLFALLTILD